ncbi:hypothetical protein VULLAG_LOCUS10371 [Vulpes lagopus]
MRCKQQGQSRPEHLPSKEAGRDRRCSTEL